MNHIYDQALRLFLEKLSGTLTPEDEKYVEQMLAEDALFSEAWQKLEEENAALNTSSFLEQINVVADLHELKQKINREEKPHASLFYFKKLLAVAAVFLLVATGAYFIFFRQETIVNKEQIAATVNKKKQSVKTQ